MSDRRNVTGIWYGRFASPNIYVIPNRFIATLAEQASLVSGSTTEVNRQGPGILHASIDGVRAGGRVAFTKQYRGGRLSHAVDYAGTINGAGTEISGTWRFSRYSGSFVMTRETFSIEELEEEREVDLTG